MIDRQRVMDETRQGLDILLDLFPQAKDCVGNKNKQFKMRLSEKTPSATIRQNKAGLWVVHDFGGDDEDLNAIDAWMRVHGWDRSRFGSPAWWNVTPPKMRRKGSGITRSGSLRIVS